MKEKVLARHPDAECIHERNVFSVWDISRARQRDLNIGRGLLGLSNTEEGAWKDAALTIARREG